VTILLLLAGLVLSSVSLRDRPAPAMRVGLAALPGLAGRREARRVRALTAALPDALRRLAAELAAGRTLERALGSTGELAPEPLGAALRASERDLAAGRALDESLAARLPADPACRLLASALALQRRVGGDLPRLCRELARTLDERERVEADVRALTAQARFSAAVVPLLPPLGLLGMSLLDPVGVDRLLGTTLGRLLLLLAAILDAVSALLIRGLVRGIA
jgi:tight adherence protein B